MHFGYARPPAISIGFRADALLPLRVVADRPIEHVLSRFKSVKRSGREFVVRCPAHDDRVPSLNISEGKDGRVLLLCRAGCSTDAVVAAAGLALADLFPPREPSSPPLGATNGHSSHAVTPVGAREEYFYKDEHGAIVRRVERISLNAHDGGKPGKQFRQSQPDGHGGWRYSTDGIRAVLYNQSAIEEAIAAGRTVFVVEGEGKVEALRELGYVATTVPSGANAPWLPEYTRALTGASVIVLPDNDKPGRAHAEKIVAALRGYAASVRVLELPGLPEKGDIIDWLAAGGTREQLDKLVAGVSAQQASEPFATAFAQEERKFNDLQPLPDGLPRVEVFSELMMPPTLRPWIGDIADRMQCPPDYIAAAVMVALGSLIGRRVSIRPKCRDDWRVIPNLWGMVVGPPGFLKSPAVQEALRPLTRLEVAAYERYQEQERRWENAETVREVVDTARKRQMAEKLKKATDKQAAAAELAAELDADEPGERPVRVRYLINDATTEKLGEILRDNSNGVLVFRDELVGFLRSLEKEGRESERSTYLEAWAGDGRFSYDRIGRGEIVIPSNTISIFGCIQPGPLGSYLRGATEGAGGDDGLMQRFQVAVWPDTVPDWCNVDKYADTSAKMTAFSVFESLSGLTGAAVGAEVDAFDETGIPYLRFDAAAQELFDAWRAELEPRLRKGEEHRVIIAHLSKYRSLVPSLALTLHLADRRSGPVTAQSLQTALEWAEYLESHARRIFASLGRQNDESAKALAAHIRRQDLKSPFTVRQVYNMHHWAELEDKASAQAAVDVLVELGWLAEQRRETGGRPLVEYFVNPMLRGDT